MNLDAEEPEKETELDKHFALIFKIFLDIGIWKYMTFNPRIFCQIHFWRQCKIQIYPTLMGASE